MTGQLTLTPGGSGWDESRTPDGALRPAWTELTDNLDRLGADGLRRLHGTVDALLAADGVTWSPVPGPPPDGPAPTDPVAVSQPVRWQLDPVPLVVDADEWSGLEEAVAQRAALLEQVLADLYGPQRLLTDRVVPPALVLGHPGYLRAAHGVTLPGSRQLVVSGVDVARGPDGGWVALADRTGAPSGIGYAVAGRSVLTRALPEQVQATAPRRLGAFADALRTALHNVAPQHVEQPRVVVLSPGSHSETAFDQAYLAALLGIPLVEGSDLTVHAGRLWMRALGGLEPVDVVLRRVDADWCDPLDLRPDSRLGVVGLVEACRRGTVSVVNPLGSAVLESPALRALLPRICRALRAEDLALPSPGLHWCGEPDGLGQVLAAFDEVVLRPVDGGRSVRPGLLPTAERAVWADRLRAEPDRWTGEVVAATSTAPSGVTGRLTSLPVVARLFTVGQASGHLVMPGGLGGVLAHDDPYGPLLASKDVWVRTTTASQAVSRPELPVLPAEWSAPPVLQPVRGAGSSPRVLADLFWFGRYAERAEGLVRVLAETHSRAGDLRPGASRSAAEATTALLTGHAAMTRQPLVVPSGLAAGRVGPVQEDALVRLLHDATVDVAAAGSVAHNMARLVGVAQSVRDQLSVDTWAVLATAEQALARADVPGDLGPQLAWCHTELITSLLAVGGVVAESMIRDPGWVLLDSGRRIERAQQLVALLHGALTSPRSVRSSEVLLLESLLATTQSVLTYRRRYAGRLEVSPLLQLLLVEPDNPRSLGFQLARTAAQLRSLPGATGASPAERTVEELIARVRRLDTAALATRLTARATRRGEPTEPEPPDELSRIADQLRRLADGITRQHLTVSGQVAQRQQYGYGGVA